MEAMELELHAPDNEVSLFSKENRPVWPRISSPCLVAACGMKHYDSFKEFLNHWKSVHEEHKTLKACSCGKLFATTKHLKTHLKVAINHCSAKDKTVKNTGFISPGDILPYQLGTKDDRNDMKVLQRHLAKQKREEQVNKSKAQSSVLCQNTGQNVCRDERVVERDGTLYKDTNLWADRARQRREILK